MKGLKKIMKQKRQESKSLVKKNSQIVEKKLTKPTRSNSFKESYKSRVFKEEMQPFATNYNKFIDNLVKFLISTKQTDKSLETAGDLAYILDGKSNKASVAELVSEFAELLEDWENPSLRVGVEKNMINFISRV